MAQKYADRTSGLTRSEILLSLVEEYTRLHFTANHGLQTVDSLLMELHKLQTGRLELLAAFLPPAIILV